MKKGGQDCTGENCDFNRGLACINETCTCLDSSLKFNNDGSCVEVAGNLCGVTQVSLTCEERPQYGSKCDYFMIGCEETATCHFLGKDLGRCVPVNKAVGEGIAQTP